MDQGLRELDALLHAGRVRVHIAVPGLAERAVFQNLVGAAQGVGGRHSGHLARVRDKCHRVHAGDMAVLLGHQADTLADRKPFGRGVHPHHGSGPGRGLNKAQERFDQRGFARAVRPQKPDAPGGNIERQAGDRDFGTVADGQVRNRRDGRRGGVAGVRIRDAVIKGRNGGRLRGRRRGGVGGKVGSHGRVYCGYATTGVLNLTRERRKGCAPLFR